MAGPMRQLQQRGRRSAPGLSTLAAAETARQVVDEGGWRSEPGRPSARIDRLAGGPHPFVPAFAQQLVRSPDQRFPLGSGLDRLRGQDRLHGAGAAEFFGESLAVASGTWRRVVLGCHGSIQFRLRRRLLK